MADLNAVVEQLARRVDQLEAAQRRWRLAAGGLGLLLVAAVTTGGPVQAQDKGGDKPALTVLEARGLVIRDAKGKVRAKIGVNGQAAFYQLFDQAGKERFNVTAADKAGILGVYHPAGKGGLSVIVNGENDNTQLGLSGGGLKADGVSLLATPDGGVFKLNNPANKAEVYAASSAKSVGLAVFDADEKPVARVPQTR